jgi:hypothetical protein
MEWENFSMKKKEEANSLIEDLRKVFVSIETFNLRLSPLEKIVYSASSVIGLAAMGAIAALIIGVKK